MSVPSLLTAALVIVLPTVAWGLALVKPPPAADPVIFGTSDYCNILYGKAQRAASVYGTNLNHPLAILSPPTDSAGVLERCLWDKFGMSTSGPDGTLAEADVTRELTPWTTPQADLRGALVFIDVASSAKSGGGDAGSSFFAAFPLFGRKGREEEEEKISSPKTATTDASSEVVSRINLDLLRCAVDRECAHIYVLSDDPSLEACVSTLEEHAKSIPSTVVALERGVTLASTGGWTSSRPQDMEGELTVPVALSAIAREEISDDRPGRGRTKSFPAEDVAEVMLQVALRVDRSPGGSSSSPRIFRLRKPSDEGGGLEERLNEDYFTRTGGKKARAAAGTVQSAAWGSVLSPFGEVITNLSDRPDV